jgi:hypothetical protein
MIFAICAKNEQKGKKIIPIFDCDEDFVVKEGFVFFEVPEALHSFLDFLILIMLLWEIFQLVAFPYNKCKTCVIVIVFTKESISKKDITILLSRKGARGNPCFCMNAGVIMIIQVSKIFMDWNGTNTWTAISLVFGQFGVVLDYYSFRSYWYAIKRFKIKN